eukprot:CCRYP_003578-RA/>CCRYP_003578-RA protein AED:0.22 eAED:0.22 QI:0/-1/0/1/-1/1/1/0/364
MLKSSLCHGVGPWGRVLIQFTASFAMCYYLMLAQDTQLLETHQKITSSNEFHTTTDFPRKIDPGWDNTGTKLYQDRVLHLTQAGTTITSIYPSGPTDKDGTVLVERVQPFYISKVESKFWANLQKGGWERQTFHIFNEYINPDKTTVVDFGTWIGPTLLYHGQFSLRSFGIEADPVAFATVEYNVDLNKKLHPHWGNKITIDSGCISSPNDIGEMTMRAGIAPGASVSGIGNKVYKDQGEKTVTWKVQCRTLYDVFENYWSIHKPYKDVFIKVDIESYECKLVPSFYDWLKDEKYLPKMFISFHPQIESCTDEDFEGVLTFLKLYDHVKVGNVREMDIQTASIKDLKENFQDVVVFQDHHLQGV